MIIKEIVPSGSIPAVVVNANTSAQPIELERVESANTQIELAQQTSLIAGQSDSTTQSPENKSKVAYLTNVASIPVATDKVQTQSTKSSDDPPTLEYSDEYLAQEFSSKHSDKLKYTAGQGKWFRWTGSYWEPDRVLKTFHDVREFLIRKARIILQKKPNWANQLASASTVSNVERLARSDPRHTITVEQWDANKWIIATPKGTVDLQMGELREAKPEDYSSKITSVAPGGDAPLWKEFLERVTGRDKDMQAYLQRVAGYLLTGETREHALFFLYGPGGNGKSTFLETLKDIMKDYATTVPLGALMASKNERHPTEIAKLHGARMAVATETEIDGEWDEVRIKQLTGGDTVTARFMRQDFFDFVPQFKLIVAGNNKPRVAKVDDAIRRRFQIIPFVEKIEQPDKDFRKKLNAELGGILSWMIDGALEWQKQGLNPPKAVIEATEEYLDEENPVGQWVEDCCERVASAEEPSKALFPSWAMWCQANGVNAGSKKALTQHLSELLGIKPKKISSGDRGLKGIRLRPDCAAENLRVA